MSQSVAVDEQLAALRGIRGRLTPNAPLAPFTWFRVGGPAELLFQPADADDLADFLAQLDAATPVSVIGVGSNLLVRDGGIAGVVVRLSAKGFGQIERDGDRVRAGAALPDKRLAAFAAAEGLGGFAFLHGIPGTIGGALRMNAGANAAETCDILVAAQGVRRDGSRTTLSNTEMGYTYRHSAAPEDMIFTAGVFQGHAASADAIREAMAAVADHRERAQPIRDKTGGSTFTNPLGLRAWELIDAAGCRGLRVGDAMVSEKHCNFLINLGFATARDLEQLGETVRARVLEHSGVRLVWEIRRIGRFEGEPVREFGA
ncbi:MAG: UDP-N-acetylmuramate dehydrogenase [Alphaproteobacteria bacterium]